MKRKEIFSKEMILEVQAIVEKGASKVKQYNKAWSRSTGIEIIWIPNEAHNSNVDNLKFVNGCIKVQIAKHFVYNQTLTYRKKAIKKKKHEWLVKEIQ